MKTTHLMRCYNNQTGKNLNKHMFDKKVWENVPCSEMMAYYNTRRSAGINVKKKQLMLICPFKRKKRADGSLAKYKARLCCHGSQQQWGVNYYETYAPVVSCPARKEGVVIIICVDDCCIFANEKHEADKVVKALDGEFYMTDEGDTIEEYLGVKVDHNEDG
eukprot:5825332-Ditylum_brightwellii.AAC.1